MVVNETRRTKPHVGAQFAETFVRIVALNCIDH
jgi:hypothetical protein